MQKYPLTTTQMGIYVESVGRKDLPIYHIAMLTKLSPSTELEKLAGAIEKAVKAHSFARVRICKDEEGMPYQYLSDSAELDIKIESMSVAEFDKQKSTWPQIMDLDDSQLVHFRLIETPSDKWLYHVCHHTIFDGSSDLILAQDITKALRGEEIQPETLSIIDIAERESAKRQSPAFEQAKQWYAGEFGSIDTDTMPLPDIDSHSAIAAKQDTRKYFKILDIDYDDFFASSRRIGVKLSTLADGAFGYMSGMFVGADQSYFCTVYNGRKSPDEVATIAMMVKTLPVYCAWQPDTTVSDFLHKLQTQRDGAKQHDIYSFGEVCKDLQLKHDLMFSYRGSFCGEEFPIDQNDIYCIDLSHLSSGDGLVWVLDHVNGKLKLTAEYRSDKYSAELIESMADAYDCVLKQMLSAEKLAEIALVPEELQMERNSDNYKEFSFDDSKTIVDLFREQAQKTPDAVAIVAGGKRLTYGQLDDLSDRLAVHLRSAGVGRSDVVAIIIPRDEYMAIASLGALKSGAAYQPLDPSYPVERLNFMVQDSSAAFLIADASLADKLSGFEGRTILTKDIVSLPELSSDGAQSQKDELLACKPLPEDKFILLYTSGSTGKPKGCRLLHSNLADFVQVIQPMFHYDSNSLVSAYASYGFDANMFDLYPALTHGGTVHVIGEDIRFDMVELNNYFAAQGITHAFMTTQVARAYATSVKAPESLKYLSCGGEAFVPIDKPVGYTMYNLYGPTETTAFVTGQSLDREYDRIPIGQALPNVRLYVVDKNAHLLPPFACGELWISGRQVAEGYLNRPEKTAQAFVPNPFVSEPHHERAYRTGDTVRALKDGVIDFIGRSDGQVKVRGFRIELSELEAVIREYPDVRDATVAAYDDPAGGKFIAAYLVSDKAIDVADFNAFIAARKPPYMVPAVTMQIDKIPFNQNQKVDRRALPKPDFSAASSVSDGQSAPRSLNALEKALQQIVASVLKIGDADVATPLELLGLTSISSIKLAMAIYKRFGVDIKTSELLGLCSILSVEDKLLQAWMEASSPTATDSKEGPVSNGDNSTTAPNETVVASASEISNYPLSISQQGVYADCMRNPTSTNYNIPLLYRFPAAQNVEQLSESVKQVFASHPYLQTYFTLSGADVEQTIANDKEIVVETKAMSEDEFAVYKRGFVRPFNILKAPLYHIAIVSTPEAVYLLVDIHHIIFDGSSLGVFTSELQTLLNGGTLQSESLNYLDYVRTETSLDKSKSKQYFAELLKDCEAASEISADLPQNQDSSDQGQGVELFEYLDFDAIQTFCKSKHITPAALCLAATGYAVSRFTSSRTAYLNTVSTGRNDIHFAETIGMFVKTLPVVVDIADCSSADFAIRTAEMLRSTVEHEIYPYSDICRDYNYSPHIMYEYQLGLEEPFMVNGQEVQRESLGNDTLKFKIAVRIEMRNERPAVIVYYKDALYSEQLMRRFARAIAIVAHQIVTQPDSPARRISMLDSEDRELLKSFAMVCPNIDIPTKVFYRMFEEQVDKAPEKEILVAADGKFKYCELEQRANKIAHSLLELGLKKGECVVLLLHRTSRYFSSVFGVSKAGAVFIPTNPDYPAERIRSIVEDSAARFIITEGELLQTYEHTLDVAQLESHSNGSRPNVDVCPSDKVYMIYTSGSTGKPKGVELRHESICNYLTNHSANPQVHIATSEGTCYGAVTTVAFDMSFKEWALALCHGMKLVFASDEETLDPMALARTFSENGVDVFNATPSRLLQYLEVDSFAQLISRSKVVLSGGEKYPSNLLRQLKELTKAHILNTYGPTEITVSSNVAVLTDTDRISVGKPLLNYEEYIVDSDDNLLPLGVVGELVICGIGVGDGYHNLPEQTQKAFVIFDGKKAYRSGDYARWLPDGCVDILGRKDNQVKLRGLRIELGEIEKVLTSVEGVKSGIILIRRLGNQEAICAYYTLEAGLVLSAEEIKAAMANHLTDYMVPSAFLQLDAMPLTPNGKVNTRALPEPKQLEREAGRPAESDAEKLFAKIFADILELETVYADDNFFDLGGSSLTVTRVIIAAGKAGVDLAYADVFDNPTPEKLALLCKSNQEPNLYPDFEDLGEYDYSAIDKLLKGNTLANFTLGEKQTFSHVLLTGATGFLGIHVLYELLHNYPDCKVTCLLRGKAGVDAAMRIQAMFFYYFEQMPTELFGSRLSVLEGDITQVESFEQCKELGVDLVVNCAANVKHFSKGTDIEDVNYYGTLHLIDFCEAVSARLVHVSTMSVGGAFVGRKGDVSLLAENQLYYGQRQLSKYTQSKFMAERAILQAVADGKLSAKIMRVGTLAPRNKDGEYQINFGTNSFMARMKSTYLVGAHSFESEISTFELSPIDSVAQAILLLAQTPRENVVFHPFNNHQLLMGDLYDTMTSLGLESKAMEECEYNTALELAEQDPDKARVLTGLLAYRQGHGITTYSVGKSAPLTVAVLSRLGFHWPATDMAYTERFIVALRGLGFFDE